MYCSPNVWAWSHADIVKYDNCIEYISRQWEWKKRTELRSGRPAAALNGAVKQGTIETETSCVSVLNTYAHRKIIINIKCHMYLFEKNVLTLKPQEKSRPIGTYNISFLYRDPSHSTYYYIVFIFERYTFCKNKK